MAFHVQRIASHVQRRAWYGQYSAWRCVGSSVHGVVWAVQCMALCGQCSAWRCVGSSVHDVVWAVRGVLRAPLAVLSGHAQVRDVLGCPFFLVNVHQFLIHPQALLT
eukprot:364955-Chlamydomonas_euryale.AAC.12